MSKFVEYDEFRKELKSIKNAIAALTDHAGDASAELAERIEKTVDAVNQNADAGAELSRRLDDLQKRVERISRQLQDVRVDVNTKNDSGTVVAFLVGAVGVVAFLALLSEIDILKKKLDSLGCQNKKGQKEVTPEKTFRSDNGDSGSDPVSSTKED